MTKKKKIITGIVSLALVAAVGIGATFAFLMDHAEKVNQFTIGTIDTDIEEPGFPSEVVVPITPDEIVVKDPLVVNKSQSNDCYTRMNVSIPMIEVQNSDGSKSTIEMFQFGMLNTDQILADGKNPSDPASYQVEVTVKEETIKDENGQDKVVKYTKKVIDPKYFTAKAYNDSQWVLVSATPTVDKTTGNHVYTFYYNGPTDGKLAPLAQTESIFNYVQLDIRVKEGTGSQNANILVTSDAIQTEGYDIPAGDGCIAQRAFAAVEK